MVFATTHGTYNSTPILDWSEELVLNYDDLWGICDQLFAIAHYKKYALDFECLMEQETFINFTWSPEKEN